MNRLALVTLCLATCAYAVKTHSTSSGGYAQVEKDDAMADMSNGQEDVDYDEGLEISLLQTSLKLSRQEVPPASEESNMQIYHHESSDWPPTKSPAGNANRVDHFAGVPGAGDSSNKLMLAMASPAGSANRVDHFTGVPGAGNSSNKLMLAMASLSQQIRRTRDIIPLPGACVLGLAFLITFTCVVVLWGLMMEAATASNAPVSNNTFGEPDDLDKGATISFGKLPRFQVFESQPSTKQTQSAPPPPPPRICPALTLPAGAEQFRIPAHDLNRLRAGDLAVQILGPDEKPLLHAGFPLRAMENEKGQIGYNKVGRWLQLKTSASSKQPHVSIGPLPISNQNGPLPNRFQNIQVQGQGLYGSSAGRVPIEIYGPSNTRYGTLRRTADKWQVFYRAAEGPEQHVMSMHAATPFPGFAAYSTDGKQMALASLHSLGTGFSSGEMLTITVRPGLDYMLILITMLAVVLTMFEQVPSTKGPDIAGVSSTSKSLPHATSQSLPLATNHSLPPGFQPDA